MSEEKEPIKKEPNFFLYTLQMAQCKKLARDGLVFMDITAKSGIEAFAPHWHDLKDFKYGGLSEAEYEQRYLEKMYDSMQENKSIWNRLSVFPYVAYVCYCPAGEFCHRHLFVKLAKSHLEGMGWTPVLRGEYSGSESDLVIPERFIKAYPKGGKHAA